MRRRRQSIRPPKGPCKEYNNRLRTIKAASQGVRAFRRADRLSPTSHRVFPGRAAWKLVLDQKNVKKPRQNEAFRVLGLSWALLGLSWTVVGHLRAILDRLGPSWDHLGATVGHLGAILGPSWTILGHLGASLGPSWAILGPPGAILGLSWTVLGHLGALLGRSWAILGTPWAILGAILGLARLSHTPSPAVLGSKL